MDKFDCSDEEYSVLVEKYGRMIGSIAKKYVNSCREHDFKDLVQEGEMVMLKAKRMYNPNKGAKFITYLHTAVRRRFNKISDEARRVRDTKDKIVNDHIEQDQGLSSLGKIDSCKLFKNGELRSIIDEELAKIPEIDRKIIKLRSEGRTYSEIGKLLNFSGEYIKIRQNNAIEKIKRKLL